MIVEVTIKGHYEIKPENMQHFYGTNDKHKAIAIDRDVFDQLDMSEVVSHLEDAVIVSMIDREGQL